MKKWRLFSFKKIIAIMMITVLLASSTGSYMVLSVQAEEPNVENITSESETEEEYPAELTADSENSKTESDIEENIGKTNTSADSTAESITKMDVLEEDGSENESTEDETVLILDGFSDLPDNDELLMGYIDQLFYEDMNTGISMYGNVGAQRITDANEKKVYNGLKPAIEQIAAGSRTSTIITVSGLNFNLSTVRASIKNVIYYLLMDCPYDFYWFDKTLGYGFEIIGNTYNFYFSVAEEYQGNDEYTTDSSKTGAATQAVSNAKAIVTRHALESDREKLNSYCDEICCLADYNKDASNTDMAYGNPWQLIWVFDGNSNTKVVCEGYSKAFQYLCDLSDFKNADTACYTVTGLMVDGSSAGGHMWNIVTLEGNNYLADATNSDAGSESNNLLFLVTPDSGTVDTNYVFYVGSQAVAYKYDTDQITLFGRKILRLSGTNEPEYEDNPNSSTETNTGTGTVSKPIAPVSKSVTISLNGQSLKNNTTLKATFNKKYTFKATVIDTTGKTLTGGNGKITWSSSNKKIATVSANGKVTIKKKSGTVTITAKTADGTTATVKLKAGKGAVKATKVKITGSKSMSLKTKKTQTLKATVTPASAANRKVTWKSSNKKIATVNSKGKVTAKKKGTVKITATAKDGSKKKATIKIKISK